MKALTGGKATVRTAWDDPNGPWPDRKKVMDTVRAGLARGLSVPVGLEWGGRDAEGRIHAGHEVLVTRIAQGRVHYHNPWGQQESMPLAQFQERLGGAVVADFATIKPKS
ncbi:hypothetical protein D3C72_1602500 [compost metagenome]